MLWAPESSSAEGGTSPSPVFHSKSRVQGSARTPMPSTPTGPPARRQGWAARPRPLALVPPVLALQI